MNRKIFLKSRGIALEAKAKQLNPNIRPILLIFDPIEFPNAISGVSLSTDEMLTNISGADVPRAIKVKPIMYLALSYDHRIIDGKDSVSFLKTVKENLEDPRRLFLNI